MRGGSRSQPDFRDGPIAVIDAPEAFDLDRGVKDVKIVDEDGQPCDVQEADRVATQSECAQSSA